MGRRWHHPGRRRSPFCCMLAGFRAFGELNLASAVLLAVLAKMSRTSSPSLAGRSTSQRSRPLGQRDARSLTARPYFCPRVHHVRRRIRVFGDSRHPLQGLLAFEFVQLGPQGAMGAPPVGVFPSADAAAPAVTPEVVLPFPVRASLLTHLDFQLPLFLYFTSTHSMYFLS